MRLTWLPGGEVPSPIMRSGRWERVDEIRVFAFRQEEFQEMWAVSDALASSLRRLRR